MQPTRDLQIFLDISAQLTGFQAIELEATGMVSTYFKTAASASASDVWADFLRQSRKVLEEGSGNPARMRELIAQSLFPTHLFNGLAVNITFMWYSGQWAPTVDAPDANLATVTNISADAYVQGLMWTAAHTHPPGAKQPGFGSWARLPVTAQS